MTPKDTNNKWVHDFTWGKKCTQVHSVLVGVMLYVCIGSIHHHYHHRRRCLKNYWLVRKCKCVINTVPPKTSSATELRPETQRRKSPPPYWNPQMSVRQETRKSSLLERLASLQHTRTKTVRVKRELIVGGVYNAVRAAGVLSFTSRAVSCRLQVLSDQTHMLPAE